MKALQQPRRLQRPRRAAVNKPADRAAVQEVLGYPVQTKLKVGSPQDAQEHEADAVAERVMAAPAGQIQRKCAACEQEDDKKDDEVQRKETPAGAGATLSSGQSQAIASARGGGRSLPAGERSFFESRMGADFSKVRVHEGGEAAQLSAGLSARAFTVGGDVYFGQGEYRPGTDAGRRLIAHELTHVMQQGAGETVRRAGEDRPPDPAPTPGCSVNSDCPEDFCKPLPMMLWDRCTNDIPFNLAGIAAAVSPRVVGLWWDYMGGGTGQQDLSGKFGADFTNSQTTATTTDFLVAELRRELTAHRPIGAAGSMPLMPLISGAIAAINRPNDAHAMDFNAIGEVPGNIAGGIGANQSSCSVGATPSTQADDRLAGGTVDFVTNADGSMTVTANIQYTVHDTVDLCPGNCGAGIEQIATVPMSRCEASGIYGDVPFVVNFAAPVRIFTLPAVSPAIAPVAPAPAAPAPTIPAPVAPAPAAAPPVQP